MRNFEMEFLKGLRTLLKLNWKYFPFNFFHSTFREFNLIKKSFIESLAFVEILQLTWKLNYRWNRNTYIVISSLWWCLEMSWKRKKTKQEGKRESHSGSRSVIKNYSCFKIYYLQKRKKFVCQKKFFMLFSHKIECGNNFRNQGFDIFNRHNTNKKNH